MLMGFPGGLGGKETAYNEGDTRDRGSIPGLGRTPGGGLAKLSSILACRIPWTEEPGRLHPIGCKESDKTEATELSTEHIPKQR